MSLRVRGEEEERPRGIVKDLDALRNLLEDLSNPELVNVYRQLLGEDPVEARLAMYPHGNGWRVPGKTLPQWIYVELRGRHMEYQAALWKIILVAKTMHPQLYRKLAELVQGV